MSILFRGPCFDYVMSLEPLRGAEYVMHGSSAMLFQRDGNLYRLTTCGGGHCFLADQSAKGNPSVVRVIHDFGPLAPADDDDGWVYYWLAQVEWLEEVDAESPEGSRLNQILLSLAEDGAVMPEDRPQFFVDCEKAAATHEEFAPLLRTLILAAKTLGERDGVVDSNLSNVMRRPVTGEIVWIDPIDEAIGHTTKAQDAEMERIRELYKPATEFAWV